MFEVVFIIVLDSGLFIFLYYLQSTKSCCRPLTYAAIVIVY